MSKEDYQFKEILDIAEEAETDEIDEHETFSTRRNKPREVNKSVITQFLGKGKRVQGTAIVPRYYRELLTWALKRYMEKESYQVVQTLGYSSNEPMFTDVNTGVDKRENLLMDGQILVEKGDERFIITLSNMQWQSSIIVEGAAVKKTQIEEFAKGVISLSREQNFYRGQKVEFAFRLRFLNLKDRSWESIILDENIKRSIKANTIGFLNKGELWDKYNIPPKRGVLLAGEPGTGKTIICKALMAEAAGITCLSTKAYDLSDDDYVTDLYELAEDLSPCIVFIEDIDLIGQNREEFGYQKGNALLSLLSVLDGIEEKKKIVTVATTNCLEMLDKALSQRPSRFDRVIKLIRPALKQRREQVERLCRSIPISEGLQGYIAHKTEGCTPAQVQEVIHSLVIEKSEENNGSNDICEQDVDSILSRINGRHGKNIGFSISDGNKGSRPGHPAQVFNID